MIKRGLSPVIATMLLVVLTVGAIVLVSSYLVPFVKNSLGSTSCVKYLDHFQFDESFEYNCYTSDKKLYGISIKAGDNNTASEDIVGFNLVFKEKGNSKAIMVKGGAAGICTSGGIVGFNKACSSLIEI